MLIFFTPMGHIRKPTQMGFPENQPKMLQLHGPLPFSKTVVRGWYIPHFDHTDLLTSKNQVWGGFRNLSDLYGPICEIFDFFFEISIWATDIKKSDFFRCRVRKNDRKLIFFQIF